MAGASIVIDQAGNPAGVPSTSREDLDLFTGANPVVLTNDDDSGVTSWAWTMVDRPNGSAATLTTPGAASSSFNPDVRGSYLIRLVITDATGTVQDERIAAIVLAATGWRVPAANEEVQFDPPVADPKRGWATELDEILRDLDSGGGIFFPLQQAYNDGATIDTGANGSVDITREAGTPNAEGALFVADADAVPGRTAPLVGIVDANVVGAGTPDVFQVSRTVAGSRAIRSEVFGAGDVVWSSGLVAPTETAVIFGDGDCVLGDSVMAGTEKLRVVGDEQIEGTLLAPKTGTATGTGNQAASEIHRFTASTWDGAEQERDHDFYAYAITSADETGSDPVAGFAWDIEGTNVLKLHGTSISVAGGAIFRSAATGPIVPFTFLAEDNLTSAETLIAFGENAGESGPGTVRATIAGSGSFRGPLGSTSAPTFSFTGGTDRGLYSVGTDVLGLAAGATGIFFVDGSGTPKFVELPESGTALSNATQYDSHHARLTESGWDGAEALRSYDIYAEAPADASDESDTNPSRLAFDVVGSFTNRLLEIVPTTADPASGTPPGVIFRNTVAVGPGFEWRMAADYGDAITHQFTDNEGASVLFEIRGNGSYRFLNVALSKRVAGADIAVYSRGGDQDTGVGFPDNDELALVAGALDALTVEHAVGNNATTVIVTANNSGTTGSVFRLHSSKHAADGDEIGVIRATGENAGGTFRNFSEFQTVLTESANLSEKSQWEMSVIFGDSSTAHFPRIAQFFAQDAIADESGLVIRNSVAADAGDVFELRAEAVHTSAVDVFRVTQDDGGTMLFQVDGDGDAVVAQDIEAVGGFKCDLAWFREESITGTTTFPLNMGATSGSTTRTIAPCSYSGSILGVSWTLTAAITTGDMTINVKKNGSTVFTTGAVTAQFGTSVQAKDTSGDTFVADDRIEVDVVTNGMSQSLDVTVFVVVEQ